jgi:hypothetical protein
VQTCYIKGVCSISVNIKLVLMLMVNS